MRLIDADVASRWMEQNEAYMDAEILRAIPTVDAVPVVRCKDCENAQNECGGMIICRVYKHIMWLQNFCSYGKRKDEGVDND
ncbi:hypothetical protein [Agathobaculum sp.]|uniref:hypothetical protein n=1 Tax=Agathobaculum sp. TaxID=2048138 RepID=UPI003AF0451E